MRNIFLIGFVAVTLFSCRSSKPVTGSVVVEPLPEIKVEKIAGLELNGTWQLQKLWSSENKWNTAPNIDFNFKEKTFTGNTGCNDISGKFMLKENFIAINKEIITTKMACSNYNEKTFLSVLLKINRYKVEDNVLELSQDDLVLMKFSKTK